MKTKLTGLTLAALLGMAAMTSALAQNKLDAYEGAQQAKQGQAAAQANPLGAAVSGGASRVVNLDNTSKYLNVVQMETVQINVGGKSVTWNFDTLGTPVFPLSKIIPGAPSGITVYVSQDNRYL